jgi:ketosteroid isomerase-like protein
LAATIWRERFRDVHPDAEWETDPRVPNAGIYRGREEIQRFFKTKRRRSSNLRSNPRNSSPKAITWSLSSECVADQKGSTAEIEHRIGALWTVRNGEIVRGQGFAEREKALEAAGLRE